MTMKRDTSFGKKMNSTPLKRFFPFFKRSWRLIQQGNWLWFWTMPGFIMQSCFGRFEIRLRVGQFMDEIMKHPHAIIDRLCVRL
ncbi:hypothetical protein P7H15_16210 [Paenibacillus larvae]|nr:hypothetical protein [Paenibacillus larvae]MDT2294057.1 hypothetical protein [Paenibacillus larvae]